MKQGIEITVPCKKQAEKGCPKMAFFFLVAGVWGILSLFCSLEGICFPLWILYSFAAVSCWLIWHAYYSRGKIASVVLVIFVLANIAFLCLKWKLAMEQGQYIIECFQGKSSAKPMAVTETMLFFTVLLSFFMAMFEFVLGNHEILYLLTTLLLLGSPLWGIQADTRTVFFLAFFQIGFWTMRIAEFRNKKGILKKGREQKTAAKGSMQGIAAKSSMIAGGVVLALFLAAWRWMPAQIENLYDSVYQAEGYISRMMSRASGKAAERASGGKLNGGNNYQAGVPHLEITTDRMPTEDLYLYGFQGGEYMGGEWALAGDEELLLNILARQEWRYGVIFSVYRQMYYEICQAGMGASEEHFPDAAIKIVHCNGQYDNRSLYAPYCSTEPRYYIYAVAGEAPASRGYGYSYYEQREREIDWDKINAGSGGQSVRYQVLQQLYMEEVKEAYTHVPTELLPQLTELCRKNPQNNLEDITAFILYTLHSNTSYTMTPGWTPLNEDIAEYFLFRSGRGYCEHYATTAALMYRLYGIPARYVTGYKIPRASFQLDVSKLGLLAEQLEVAMDTLLKAYDENPDASMDVEGRSIHIKDYIEWNAVATDEMAHAWVEIFLEDYGWTPIEMTPASNGSIAAGYPGFHKENLAQKMEEYGWDINAPSLAVPMPDGQEGIAQEGRNPPSQKGTLEGASWEGILAVYIICLLPMGLECHRLRKIKKLGGASSRKVFGQLLHMLQFGGHMAGYDGTEEDFAVKLAGQIGVPLEEIQRLQDIVSEAAYGLEGHGFGQEGYVRRMYFCIAKAAYRRLRWDKKLIFCYWKGYL